MSPRSKLKHNLSPLKNLGASYTRNGFYGFHQFMVRTFSDGKIAKYVSIDRAGLYGLDRNDAKEDTVPISEGFI